MKLDVHFLGVPQILLDGNLLRIPQKKLFALFLYILYHASCTREELTGVFWSELEEESGRQNLRNALYRLKSAVGAEVLWTDSRTVGLGPQVEISRDTDVLVAEDAGPKLLELTDFIFLDKLYLRDTPEFEKWVQSMQSAHEKILAERLENNMHESLRSGNQIAQAYAKKLLSVSPYHEEAVRVLIQHYTNRGEYGEAIRLYNHLALTLRDDLGILPEDVTQEAYRTVLELRDAHRLCTQDQTASPKHSQIMDELRREYTRFLASKEYCHCIIQGMMGAGKSELLESFIQHAQTCHTIRIKFDFAHSNSPFFAISQIAALLAKRCGLPLAEASYCDFETLKLYYIISMDKIARKMETKKLKTLILIENLEAVDTRSMEIIFSHLIEKCWGEIMLVGEYCTSFHSDHQVLRRFSMLGHVRLCPLPCLSRTEAAAYLSKHCVSQNIQELNFPEIWAYTGGNLMLLDDVAQRINEKKDSRYVPSAGTLKKLEVLLSSLTPGERDCLEMLAAFRYGAEPRVLAEITGSHCVALANTLEQLFRRELVTEESFEHHLLAKISSEMLRMAIYNQMSRLRRSEIHRMAAAFYQQESVAGCREYYRIRELKYHYEMADWSYESVYYTLEELRYRLDYCDEFFPTLQSDPEVLDTFYLSKSDTYLAFDRFEATLNRLSSRLTTQQLCSLDMTCQYLKGRTLIRDSRGEEGLRYIRSVIETAQQLCQEDMLLKAYLEVVFSGLRTENEPLMREYIEKARSIPSFASHEKEQAILLRLEALCDIMVLDYDRAQTLLHRSIRMLEDPRLRSAECINIAAAYDYLGRIYREQKDYTRSCQVLEQAIVLCTHNNVRKSLDLFYEDLGYAQFLQGDYARAKSSFSKSLEIYNQFDNYWLRSVCESCSAMIAAEEGRPDEALNCYRRAEIFSKKDHTKNERSLLEQARDTLMKFGIL